MNKHILLVCSLTAGTLGCFGSDTEMNSQCLPAPCPWNVGGGTGTAGTGNSTAATVPARSPDPATPLWRAVQVFRLFSCIYALGFQIAVNDDLGWRSCSARSTKCSPA